MKASPNYAQTPTFMIGRSISIRRNVRTGRGILPIDPLQEYVRPLWRLRGFMSLYRGDDTHNHGCHGRLAR